MPCLEAPSGPIVNPEQVRSHANAYYTALFSKPPVHFAQKDSALEAELAEEQFGIGEDTFFTPEEIFRARGALKGNKMAGTDEVVGEMS